MSKQSGFTLVEVVMVIVVVGLLVSLLLPKLTTMQGDSAQSRNDANARSLNAAMEAAKAKGIVLTNLTAQGVYVQLAGVGLVAGLGSVSNYQFTVVNESDGSVRFVGTYFK